MSGLTPKIVTYCLHEEGIVREAYLDNAVPPRWTWAGGVTNASGHQVYPRYKDKPQPLERCIAVTVWLMERVYLPAVQRAFAGFPLNEAQLAAALSFQWNTGAIEATSWVRSAKAGRSAAARAFLETHYTNDRTNDGINNGSLTARRKREAALFFDGRWPADLRVPVWSVSKPSYKPVRPVPTDVTAMLQQIMGGR